CEVEAEGECDESGVAKVDQRVKMDLIEDLLQIWEILECNECVNSENVYSHSVKSYPSNDVLPLQYYTNENQILGLFGVRNTGVLGYAMSVLLKVKAEVGEASKNPQDLLLEAIHSAGYSGALANPLLASESALNGLNDSVLEEFVAENYTAPRIVLAASGVEHEELLSIAKPLLSDLPNVPRPEEPKSVYTRGDYRCHTKSGRTYFALAFELPGGWHKLKDAMVLTVLQVCQLYIKALVRRGEAHEKLEHFEETIADMKKILEIDPSNDQARKAIRRVEPLATEKWKMMKR
ncbi:hypothetical protein HN51_000916, partial [Arachis hypogaea]